MHHRGVSLVPPSSLVRGYGGKTETGFNNRLSRYRARSSKASRCFKWSSVPRDVTQASGAIRPPTNPAVGPVCRQVVNYYYFYVIIILTRPTVLLASNGQSTRSPRREEYIFSESQEISENYVNCEAEKKTKQAKCMLGNDHRAACDWPAVVLLSSCPSLAHRPEDMM